MSKKAGDYAQKERERERFLVRSWSLVPYLPPDRVLFLYYLIMAFFFYPFVRNTWSQKDVSQIELHWA